MDYTTLHETVISDIYDTIKKGISDIRKSSSRIGRSSSLARATSGLTLVFPVLCTDTLPLDAATMVSKAIERKATSMLQIALSAYNITNATDAIEHLKNFHTNLDIDDLTVDKFIDIMDSVAEGTIFRISESDKRAIYEDCKRNINYYFMNDINPISLNKFVDKGNNGSIRIIKEAPNSIDDYNDGYNQGLYDAHDERDQKRFDYQQDNDKKNYDYRKSQDNRNQANKDREYKYKQKNDQRNYDYKRSQDNRNQENKDRDYEYRKNQDTKQNKLNQDKFNYQKDRDKKRDNVDNLQMRQQASNDMGDRFQKMLIDSDVKKANEMQPTLILVNYYVNNSDRDLNIAQQTVAGIKAKLYPIASVDIISKLITKNADSDIILKLVKLSTREISLVKDFLLGAEDAKLDALGSSKKNSGYKIFNALERRAGKSKAFKFGRMDNAYKAITTLVITSEEAEEIKKNSNLDVSKTSSIIPIMTKLNLLHFVIVDTTSEAVAILTDGDNKYEMYSFANLEREASDTNYKKVINLMTKVAR